MTIGKSGIQFEMENIYYRIKKSCIFPVNQNSEELCLAISLDMAEFNLENLGPVGHLHHVQSNSPPRTSSLGTKEVL